MGFDKLRFHWPLAVILVLASALVFTNLGRDFLWEDEGDTAVLASTILKEGVPKAWDGVTFTESDHGRRLTDELVMVSHPWAQYYVTAASFAVFGRTAFAARLPFAIAGLATIALVYALTFRATGSRRAAASAALLLVASVQFLIFSRQARNYSLHALLTCLLVWQFLRLRSWPSAIAFAAIAAALFHTHPIGLAAVGALAAVTVVFVPFRPMRRWMMRALPIVAVLTVPWLFAAWRGYGENTFVLQSPVQLLPRLAQFGVECASVAPLVGIAALFAFVFVRPRAATGSPSRDAGAARRSALSSGEWALVAAVGAIGAAEALVIAVGESRDVLWTIGIRYTPAVLPFAAMLAGLLIVKASRSKTIWIALLLVFGLTKAARVTPWVFWEEPTPLRDGEDIVTFHQPSGVADRIFRTGQIAFLKSLVRTNPGTLAHVIEFLRAHAAPGDLVVANYGWDSIYFHTGLPQAMKIAASDDSYAPARALGLPEYVFSPGRVRWIVWRPAWGDSWGQNAPKLIESLSAEGVPVTHVATIPETLWENRENIHFRRFAGNRYVFPWFERVPDAQIYRVDWPPALQ
jgi:4-amino-4-deoxy-L-arabinose transferase-like glycosyltransferase